MLAIQKRPFSLFCLCTVLYDGRASSVLPEGRYLVLYKPDGSVLIHGADSLVPRNYMGAGSDFAVDDGGLCFVRKSEKIVVSVSDVVSLTYLDGWADHKISICRTEKELALKIFHNWSEYFDDDFQFVYLEYPTKLGPIDVMGATESTDYVVEVKRKSVTVKDVTQLRRYMEARHGAGREVRGYVAAPAISKSACEYLAKHGLNYLHVDFE